MSKRVTKQQMKDTVRNNHNITGIYNIGDIKYNHVGHWFDKAAMKFFNSRLTNIIYCSTDKAFFVSSEQFNYNSPRKYTVRCLDLKTRSIETVGQFNELSRVQAKSLALKSAYEDTINKQHME